MESTGLPPGTSRWEVRRKQFKARLRSVAAAPGIAAAPPQRETVGDFVGLCLLIQFPDVPGTITRDEVDNFCNKTGYTGFGNTGSVYDYFLEVSSGKLRYKNVVTPYYTAKHPRKYYTNESVAQPIRARQLIKEALDHFRTQGFNFASLTRRRSEICVCDKRFLRGNASQQLVEGALAAFLPPVNTLRACRRQTGLRLPDHGHDR